MHVILLVRLINMRLYQGRVQEFVKGGAHHQQSWYRNGCPVSEAGYFGAKPGFGQQKRASEIHSRAGGLGPALGP